MGTFSEVVRGEHQDLMCEPSISLETSSISRSDLACFTDIDVRGEDLIDIKWCDDISKPVHVLRGIFGTDPDVFCTVFLTKG
ncbi:hypothetical protein LPB41_00380 [Thalassospira sp. MA62]|nr:hypothetical protein [Thalassospira sp. MA62]